MAESKGESHGAWQTAGSAEGPRDRPDARKTRGTVGHGGLGGVRGRGPGCVGEGAQAPAQREGEPPGGSEQKKARSSGSPPGPPRLPCREWAGGWRAEEQKPGLESEG